MSGIAVKCSPCIIVLLIHWSAYCFNSLYCNQGIIQFVIGNLMHKILCLSLFVARNGFFRQKKNIIDNAQNAFTFPTNEVVPLQHVRHVNDVIQ